MNSKLLLALASLCVAGHLFSQKALADRTYVYKEVDGTLWYTNVEPTAQDTARFKLVSISGRATASVSCNGISAKQIHQREMLFDSTIQQYSREYRVDSKLIKAVVRNESCFDRNAVSSAGAQGLMQLMPPTARSLGVTDSFDAQQNLRGGIQYLSELIAMYDNNLALALAAYNAGPGTVNKYNGVPPYPETQRYVEKVMKSYRRYLREYLDIG